MRTYLLHLLFIAVLSTHSIASHGQDSAYGKLLKSIPEPIYLLNSTTIANGLLVNLDKASFKKVELYKDQDGPGALKNMSSSGIVDISYDRKVASKSFAEIASQQGLHGPVTFILNGSKLSDAQLAVLRIAPEAIGQLSITQPTSGNPDTVVSIQLAVSKKTSQINARSTNESKVMIR